MYFIVGECRQDLKYEYLIFVLVFHNFNFSRARTIIIIINITVCDNNKNTVIIIILTIIIPSMQNYLFRSFYKSLLLFILSLMLYLTGL